MVPNSSSAFFELDDKEDDTLVNHVDNNDEMSFLSLESNDLNDSADLTENEITEEMLNISILSVFYSGKMTQHCLNLVLKLFKMFTNYEIPSTFDQLSKILLNKVEETINYSKKWFCSDCKKIVFLENPKQRSCIECSTKLDIFYHVPLNDQVRRLFKKKVLPVQENLDNDLNIIEDVFDSEFYKSFKASIEENGPKKTCYSLIFNTDGIELSNKSNISIWPVYLAINELPVETRYYIDNILITGILVSNGKPETLNHFLSDIIIELKMLEFGVTVNNEIYKFFCIFGVFDKPARSLILNTILSSGYFGCIKCYHQGTSVSYKNGFHNIFESNQVENELRDNSKYLEDLANSKVTKSNVNGIKGETILMKLKFYKTIESTVIDSMHTIFLGVIKKLFRYWFEFSSKEPYSLKNKKKEINERLQNLRPPSSLNYAPRDISLFNICRSHEFMNFILFYSIPVFYDIMGEKYFSNLILLIISLQVLYAKQIDRSKLESVKILKNLKKFVGDVKEIYDIHILTSSFHELLHLVDLTYQTGPINNTSCYPFEELNRKITRMINGKDLIADEFIKLWTVSQCISIYVNGFLEFLKENFEIKSSNLKKFGRKSSKSFVNLLICWPFYIGQQINVDLEILNQKILNLLRDQFGEDLNLLYFSDKVHVNSQCFKIDFNKSKFCNSFIRNNETYGYIKFTLSLKRKLFIICKKLIYIHKPFYCLEDSKLKSHFFFAAPSNEYFCIKEFDNLFIIFGQKHNDSMYILNDLSTEHLFT
ncbi:unnamed protein product [Brachionus calyciflorus]|uniref:Uncharacterized protein n=1 Tax=Brachionus calyciflorus TaxID=104777 RepID=A0A813V453_9BILA|nr:unnamed protein product [Brachionus calyciflorus]